MVKTINKAFQYRLYPTVEQGKILASHFGQARFVYNYFLRKRIDYYAANKGHEKQSLNYHDTAKMLTELKQQPKFAWLKESNSQSLQQSLRPRILTSSMIALSSQALKRRAENSRFLFPSILI